MAFIFYRYMRNITLFISIVLSLLLLGFGHVAYARDYAVELIVFDRPDGSNEVGEVWNFSSQRIDNKLQKMHDLAVKSIDYATLPALNNADTNYKIMPALDHLAVIRNNVVAAGYRILHTANWIQPAATYRYAPLISFGTADSVLPYGFIKIYKTALIFADIAVQYSPEPTLFMTANTATATANTNDAGISIGANDDLNTPNTRLADINREPQQPHFFISEKRRLKFKEIHYFDHPMFGVIVGVWSSK